jgi:uncharacterized protein (TIGR02270 family)
MTTMLFIPEIVDRHLENAASLWLARDYAVGRSSFRLADLVKLDERLEANIDALRIAEADGWSQSIDALDQGEAGDFFAAAVLALESGDPGRFDRVIERAYATAEKAPGEPYHTAYDPWRGIVSALAWVDRAHAAVTISRLLDTPRPRTRWLGVAACGARRTVREAGIEAMLADHEPLVRARAARTIGELGRTDLRAKLNALLADPDETCRFWAAWSATRLGTTEGLRVLAAFVHVPDDRRERALDLLLRRLSVDRANVLLRPLASDPKQRRAVIRATAVIGDALYVPWLINQAGDDAVARPAGEAFTTITGADLAGLERSPPSDFRSGPNDDPDDEAVALDEDDGLAWPDLAKLARWWDANKSRFNVGTAYFLGAPKDQANWIAALLGGGRGQRWAATLELALRSPGHAMFEPRGRGNLQREQLRRAAEVAAGRIVR